MAFSNEYNLNVDIKRRLTSTVPTFRQGDNGILRFKVYDDGKLFDLSTYTSSEITFVLPSGDQLVGNLDLINGELVYNFTKAEMAEIGKIETFLSITSGLTTVSVQPFYCFIFGTMNSENLSYIGILQELIKEVQDLQLSLGGLLIQLQETLDLADSTVDALMTLLANVESSETQRITDEDIRIANELIRLDNEQLRNSRESTRVEAEEVRVANELLRVNTLNELLEITGRLESFDYSSSVTYNFPNFVTYNGSTYLALQEVSGIIPNNDKINWRLMAQRGVDGTGSVSSVNGMLPDQNGDVTIEIEAVDVIDNLESTSTTDALSANMGRNLKSISDNKILTSTIEPITQQSNDIWFDASQNVISDEDVTVYKSKIRQRREDGGYDYILPYTTIDQVNGLESRFETIEEELSTHEDNLDHTYYSNDTGTANAKVLSIPNITEYKKGLAISFVNNITNTGASTVNINGLGVVSLLNGKGAVLTNGKLTTNIPYTFRYNGTSFILQGESGGEYGTAIASDVLQGKTIGTENGLVNGTIVNRGAYNITPSTVVQSIPSGYHNGGGVVYAVQSNPSGNGTLVNGVLTISGIGFIPSTLYVEFDSSTNTPTRMQYSPTRNSQTNRIYLSVTNSNPAAGRINNDWVVSENSVSINLVDLFGASGSSPYKWDAIR